MIAVTGGGSLAMTMECRCSFDLVWSRALEVSSLYTEPHAFPKRVRSLPLARSMGWIRGSVPKCPLSRLELRTPFVRDGPIKECRHVSTNEWHARTAKVETGDET